MEQEEKTFDVNKTVVFENPVLPLPAKSKSAQDKKAIRIALIVALSTIVFTFVLVELLFATIFNDIDI